MDGTVKRCTYAMAWTQVWAPNGKQIDPLVRGWAGSLLQDKREPNGLLYRRNRYLDPATGRFTQPDPIGLAGGLNAYGYANGDPVGFSDPFGLEPFVQCRSIDGVPGYSHCALRIVDAERGLDVTIELIPIKKGGENVNEVKWHSATGNPESSAATALYSSTQWSRVDRPSGMSESQFDDAVLRSALNQTRSVRGQKYGADGSKNSNRFVYESVTGAGGKVPSAAAGGKLAPGICGGTGWLPGSNGTNCSP